jgi:hypothetical protein
VQLQSVQLLPLINLPLSQIKAAVLIFSHQEQELFQLGLAILTSHTQQAVHQWQAHMLRALLLFTWD